MKTDTPTNDAASSSTQSIKDAVRERYAEAARRLSQGSGHGCCGAGQAPSTAATSCCEGEPASTDPVSSRLYGDGERSELPREALEASLGCGNPTALARLRPGEVVLDLGSGGGIDVLLSARRVAPGGKAYGLDMTDEMLELARRNQLKAGVENAEFLKGEMEHIPLPDASVDVVISNCVINLAADKRQVLAEAYRVLRKAGRLAISDIVVRGAMPEAIRRDMELWAGCVAGALEEQEYRRMLEDAGFADVDIEPTRIHSPAGHAEDGAQLMSAFVRASKP